MARALLPASLEDAVVGTDERDARPLAGCGEVGVLGEEAVAGVDRVGPGLERGVNDAIDVEVRADGMSDLTDLVGLVRLQPVLAQSILEREEPPRS